MAKITIDLDELQKISLDAGKIVLSSDAEDVLVKILEAEEMIEQIKQDAKAKILEEGLKHSPLFTGVQSDRVRVGYRVFGSAYTIDPTRASELPKEVYTVTNNFKVDPKGLDAYLEKHKGLPLGIIEKKREKQITFGLKKSKE